MGWGPMISEVILQLRITNMTDLVKFNIPVSASCVDSWVDFVIWSLIPVMICQNLKSTYTRNHVG